MKYIQYSLVLLALAVGALIVSAPHAEPAAGAQPSKPPTSTSSSGGSILWDGGNGQVAFGQNGALTGTPGLVWDGGAGTLVFSGKSDGGIVFQTNSDDAIFFNGFGSPDGEYMAYSANLTGGILMRTNGLDIGHGSSGGAGTLTVDGNCSLAAAKQTYLNLWSDAPGYFHMLPKGSATDIGLAISPQGAGRVMINTITDDGVHMLQIDGGIVVYPAVAQAGYTQPIGSWICLDASCNDRISTDGGNGTAATPGGMYFRSDTVDTSVHVNPAFVFDAYNPDTTSPLASANIAEFRSAGALEFSIGPSGQITSSGVTLSAGTISANSLTAANLPYTLNLSGNMNSVANAIAVKIGNAQGAMAAGQKIVDFCNGDTQAGSFTDCASLVASIDLNGYLASTTPFYYSVFTGTGVLVNASVIGEQVLPAHAMTVLAYQWRVSTAGAGGTTGLVIKASDGTNTCTVTKACTVTGNQRGAAVNGAGTGCVFPASASITYTVDSSSDCAVYPVFLGLANVEEEWQ